MEFVYAASTASRIAYSTYIYTQVPLAKFQVVTAYTKAALLAGRCMAGILGQTLIATGLCDYSTLNYISLGFVSSSTVFACFLPSVSHSIYFHRGKSTEDNQIPEVVPLTIPKEAHNEPTNKPEYSAGSTQPSLASASHSKSKAKTSVYRLLWEDFTTAFSESYTRKWSLWWAFATCGFFQVVNYIQPLWETLVPLESEELVYNGAVEAIHALLGIYLDLNIELIQS